MSYCHDELTVNYLDNSIHYNFVAELSHRNSLCHHSIFSDTGVYVTAIHHHKRYHMLPTSTTLSIFHELKLISSVDILDNQIKNVKKISTHFIHTTHCLREFHDIVSSLPLAIRYKSIHHSVRSHF